MPKKFLVPKPEKHSYYKVLVTEALQEVGNSIYMFRHLRELVKNKGTELFGEEVNPDVLYILDSIYQDALDNIFDTLANANDLKMAAPAITAIEKSIQIRRGFTKIESILK